MAAKVGGPRGVESRAVIPVSVIAGALQGREKAYVKGAALSPPIIYQSRDIGPIRPAIPGQATCLRIALWYSLYTVFIVWGRCARVYYVCITRKFSDRPSPPNNDL